MRKIRTAIVGFGRIGHCHAEDMAHYPDKYSLVAIADNDPERIKNLPESIGEVKTYLSLTNLLHDNGVDMITIGTRHPDHVPMAIKILEAGKCAVIEKPIACSVAQFDELMTVAAKHPNKLFFRHNRRFEAAFVKVQQLIADGVIGDVQYIKLYRSVGYCRRNDWMTMTRFYGGLLSNWGPHLIDQGLQLLDSPVVDMWSDVRRVISIGDGDDLFKILLRGKNGRVVDIEVAGCNAMPGREMEIIGAHGTIVYDGKDRINVRALDPSVELKKLKPHPEQAPLAYGNFDEKLYFVESSYQVPDIPFYAIWEKIYESAVENKPYPITAEQAREVVRITEEAFRQNHLNKMLKWSK